MEANIYSEMQHWLGKMQDSIGTNVVVAVSSSTKAGMLNIMVSWFARTTGDTICSPFLAKWTIADLAKMGQKKITNATVSAALEWKKQQGANHKEITNVVN